MGVRFWSGFKEHRIMPQPPHLKGVKRGIVKGFSFAAANRLRNLLFPLDYQGAFGMALTAPPWSTVSPETAFDTLSKTKSRCKGLRSLVWRKEVTRKGVPHYHVIVFTANRDFGDLLAVQGWILREWSKALVPRLCPARVGLCCKAKCRPADTNAGQDWVKRVNGGKDNLTLITSGNAVQYLCDHTSKHKAYQAQTTGRAWGVWFRDRLPSVRVPGRSLDDLPVRVVRRIYKAAGKMSRYFIKDKAAPFGYRWSHERRFDRMGARVMFKPTSPAALLRLVDYYLGNGSPAPALP